MIYNIRLKITHRYATPAKNGRHLIRVCPAVIEGRQNLLTQRLDIAPLPRSRLAAVDFFGQPSVACVHADPHAEMSITLACHVDVTAAAQNADLSGSVADLRAWCDRSRDLGGGSPLHFLGPAPRLKPDAAISAFARDLACAQASVMANVRRIGQAVHDAMTFDATATTVDTAAKDAFAQARGVCQDYSHIMILALQALGIPAGYVSGYLRTLPPKGGVRLEGADAMHAWVRAWCGPVQGWVEYDPTNAMFVASDHIVVAFGRDYSDVPPVTGHLRSAGGQISTQAVDVTIAG